MSDTVADEVSDEVEEEVVTTVSKKKKGNADPLTAAAVILGTLAIIAVILAILSVFFLMSA